MPSKPLDEIPEEASMQSSGRASSGRVKILYEQREEAEEQVTGSSPPSKGGVILKKRTMRGNFL